MPPDEWTRFFSRIVFILLRLRWRRKSLSKLYGCTCNDVLCSPLNSSIPNTSHWRIVFFYRRSATLIVPNSVIWIDDLHLIEFNWRHEGEGKSIDAMKNWCAIGRELNEFSMNNWVYINFGWRERGRTHWSQSHTNYIIVIRNEQTPTCQLVYVSNECVWASDES